MVPGGVTEILWHFVGYFHRIEDVMKDRFVYDDGGDPVRPDDYVIDLRDNVVKRDLEELDTDKIPFSRWPTSEQPLLAELKAPALQPFRPAEESEFDADGPRKIPATFRPVTHVAGSQGEQIITISYNDGGDELLLDIDQINRMNDDDLLHALAGSSVTQLRDFDIETTLQELVESAEAQTPESLAITLTDTESVANFVSARDAQTAENGGDENEHSVGPGRYVNGELQDEPEAEPPPVEDPPAPDLTAKGQWAELGGNDVTNAALIVDLKEATNTMIVLGDYFKTNAIIQTNAYVDNDMIEIAGGEAGAQIIGGGNKADNIAEFEQHNGIFASVPVMFAGMHWNVDVVEGNFYDINLVFQKNLMRDNDVSVQDTQHSHYEAHLGENEQLNLTQIFDGTIKYDLIIVAGDFHGANFIFQYNVLLDSDILKIAANEEAGDSPAQSASAGENTLLNNAAIITYGDNFFAIPGENLDDILAALESRSGSLDPSQGWHIPGNGSDVLNVLYVTGDYYDINAIWQVNIIADADIAIQLLSQPQPEEGEELTQSASTGGNLLTNDAAILDVGATSSLVAGGVYQDSILIQADLVTDNKDEKIVYGDPNQLVSEIIAFTGDDAAAASEIELPETGGTDLNGDPMGSILT
jgi:hypothetical protein